MEYIKAFIVGGLICVVGQIILDTTKLTPAHILVIFLTSGVLLGAIGLYEPLVKFAGSGATVPISGFGYTLSKGAIEGANQKGGLLVLSLGGIGSYGRRYSSSHIIWVYHGCCFKSKNKKTKGKIPLVLIFYTIVIVIISISIVSIVFVISIVFIIFFMVFLIIFIQQII